MWTMVSTIASIGSRHRLNLDEWQPICPNNVIEQLVSIVLPYGLQFLFESVCSKWSSDCRIAPMECNLSDLDILSHNKYMLSRLVRRFCTKGRQKSQKLISPYMHTILGEKTFLEKNQIFSQIHEAEKAQIAWRQLELPKRQDIVRSFVRSVLDDKKNMYGTIATITGKCIKDIDFEYSRVEKVYEKLISSAEQSLQEVVVEDGPKRLVKYIVEPLGIVLMFPYFADPILDSLLKLIPSLVAGNSVLIKSPPNAAFIGEYLGKKLTEASKLKELISDMFISAHDTPDLVNFRQIRQVTFSGSHSSGKHIFELVAKERFIDCNLFFGSNDAAYIDESADVDNYIENIARSAFGNCGQSLGSIQRLYIHKSRHDEVIGKLVERTSKLEIGNPMDPKTDIGPPFYQQRLLEYINRIEQAVIEGAVCHIGGTMTTDGKEKGNFIEPTILSRCQANMSLVHRQILAPVLCCSEVNSIFQFIAELNNNKRGLGASIFTKQPEKYEQHVKAMQIGLIKFNCTDYVPYNMPVEGWKGSGKGKYLSHLSYQQFIKYKSFIVNKL